MKVMFINTYGKGGGAGRAAYRLLRGLQEHGVKGAMLVQSTSEQDPRLLGPKNLSSKINARIRGRTDSGIIKLFYRKKIGLFSTNILPDMINSKLTKLNPDIIHLHWISANFLRIESIKRFQKPIIWTLHDMWAFTGGCHYDSYCRRYINKCGSCPILGSQRIRDLSRWILQRKINAWKRLNLTIVTPSNWLAQCTRKSYIFRNQPIHVIPNGLNLQKFRKYNKEWSRSLFSFPSNKKIILFGAWKGLQTEIKGSKFIIETLEKLISNGWGEELELAVFGTAEPDINVDSNVKITYLGHIRREITLAQVYSAADIFIAPSLQDNLPNTVMEAMACGTPCVTFNIGGMPDMIEHKKTGYLAKPFDTTDLAKGIDWVLGNDNRWEHLSSLCRAKAEKKFNIKDIVFQYKELYKKIINN